MSSLFHSLVVCGASITLLHCGGRGQLSEGESGGAGGAGSGGRGGGVSSGGLGAASGATATAGTTAAGGAATAPWSQVACAEEDIQGCAYGESPNGVYGLARACGFGKSLPQGPQDCFPGSVFSCSVGELNGQRGLFNCDCMPTNPEQPCPCPAVKAGCTRGVPISCNDEQVQCGCAYTCILK